jgi:hypothetical protein
MTGSAKTMAKGFLFCPPNRFFKLVLEVIRGWEEACLRES